MDSLDHPGEHARTFPRFRHLPTEIRCLIWEMAIPRRKFWLGSLTAPSPGLALPPPPVSQVCHESRSIALRRGRLFCLYYTYGFSHGVNNLWGDLPDIHYSRGGKLYWTWFDGARDVIELGKDVVLPPGGMEILRQAETILMTLNDVTSSFDGLKAIFSNKQVRQNLRTFNVQWCKQFVDEDIWHRHVVANIFGGDSLAMIDLGSSEEVQRINQLLSRARSLYPFLVKTPGSEKTELTVLSLTDYVKGLIMQTWLRGDDELKSDALGEDDVIDFDTPRIQNSLARMPHIGSVYTFVLSHTGERNLGIHCAQKRPVHAISKDFHPYDRVKIVGGVLALKDPSLFDCSGTPLES